MTNWTIRRIDANDENHRRPRWKQNEIAVGPFSSASEWEHNLLLTMGTADPLMHALDEFRFDKRSGGLVSVVLKIPRSLTPRILPTGVRQAEDVQLLRAVNVSAGASYIAADGSSLHAIDEEWKPSPASTRVEIATDLTVYFDEGAIRAWQLRDPARYIAWGWSFSFSNEVAEPLKPLAAEYFYLIHDVDFTTEVDDGSPEAKQHLADLRSRVESVRTDCPQKEILLRWIGDFMELGD
jgi:hypothetical protein